MTTDDHQDLHHLVLDDPCMVVVDHHPALFPVVVVLLHPFLPWVVVHLLPFNLDNISSHQVHTLHNTVHPVDIDEAACTIARITVSCQGLQDLRIDVPFD